MKIALQWMGMILGVILAFVAAFAMVMGAINHNDKMNSWGGYGLVTGIIMISILRIVWSGNKHKHQNAMHYRHQHK